ncbi:aldose epimerase family protein [Niallia taxi]|uniref:aldose epimerase family protein n=1 Tax=Niallia TaxID=2837506 RepID=UPI00204236CB|nr:aldose epimerase family protein [Niallia sp. MER 6]MCM3029378.1 galactose mutarotase [Niallia sp. MER 6]
MNITVEAYGKIGDKAVDQYKLTNDNGMDVTCINYGCIITSIVTPDKNGSFENIVLGYDSLQEYEQDSYFLGAVVGRIAGRIKGAGFELDGKQYTLAKNDGANHLHGGVKGYNRVVWQAEPIEEDGAVGVKFTHTSPDGDEGYPGELRLTVSYLLNNDNELSITYAGTADQKTIVNLTNHSYFNLSGNLKRDVLNHKLTIAADRFLELDGELIPTGILANVEDTVFDFREGRLIASGAESRDEQISLAGGGYDHPFLLNKEKTDEILLTEEESGRTLTISTDEAGVVLYTGNQIDESSRFFEVPAKRYHGLCLETQGLPDAINQPEFPTWVMEADEEFKRKTTYTFGTL